MERRQFLEGIAAGTAAASMASAQDQSPNEHVRIGLIGCGGRGRFVAGHMREVPGAKFVAVCDVYERNRERARDWIGNGCRSYRDFRELLDQRDIDAVLIATPDHWHCIPTVLACQAGKDVYVEKPLSLTVREGQAMVRAAREHDRVVQTGTQQRSAAHFEVIREIIASGRLGKLRYVRIWNYRNSFPPREPLPDAGPPDGLDWDFYLGPAPHVPFNESRFLGSFRNYFDYSGGIVTDFGTHRFDSMRHVTGALAPRTVSAAGALFDLHDGRDIPDVVQMTYEFPDFILSYECCALNAHGMGGRTPGRQYYRANNTDDRPNGMAFYGSNGALFADRLGFEIYPELKHNINIARLEPERITPDLFRMERQVGFSPDSTRLHAANFIDCVRTRQRPAADVEIGHRSTSVALLGNIAYHAGRKLTWNPELEDFVDDPEASRMLSRPARKPWDLI
jgi:predicted dehydrogenase